MTQTKFHCPNCKRWEAREILMGKLAKTERRIFQCDFCGQRFTENQSVAEYEAAVASEASLEDGDDVVWVELTDSFDELRHFTSIYFDELRHRGVAIMRQWFGGFQRFHSPNALASDPQYPRDVKYRVMMTKANALTNAYYVAKRETLTAILGDFAYWQIHDRLVAKIEVPSYEMVRSMLLDGDFTDDGNPEGGDYILACRVALQVTANRYRSLTST